MPRGQSRLHQDVDAVFHIDHDISEEIAPFIRARTVRTDFEIIVRDVRTGVERSMLISWPFAELDEVALTLYRLVSGDDPVDIDAYLWIYWRAWAGRLDPVILDKVPLADGVLDLVTAGRPLRGADLDSLANGLGWHYANYQQSFGKSAWKTGQLSTRHAEARKVVREYVHERMIELVGANYRETP